MAAVKRGCPRDEKARRAILEAALQVVFERGFSEVTVESIAAKARGPSGHLPLVARPGRSRHGRVL